MNIIIAPCLKSIFKTYFNIYIYIYFSWELFFYNCNKLFRQVKWIMFSKLIFKVGDTRPVRLVPTRCPITCHAASQSCKWFPARPHVLHEGVTTPRAVWGGYDPVRRTVMKNSDEEQWGKTVRKNNEEEQWGRTVERTVRKNSEWLASVC